MGPTVDIGGKEAGSSTGDNGSGNGYNVSNP